MKDEMMEQYYNFIYRIAFQYLHKESDAQDVCQEVWVRYLRSEKTFESEIHRKNWLALVTTNCCNTFLKSGWNRHAIYIDETNNSFWDTLEDKGVQPGETPGEAMPDWWEQIPESYRDIMRLYYCDELSIREIADRLGEKEATVKSRLYRGRNFMRQEFDRNREKEGLDMLENYLTEQKKILSSQGYFRKKGVGKRPAVINIDFENGWTRNGSYFSCDAEEAVLRAREICDAARGARTEVPVFFIKTNCRTEEGESGVSWADRIPLNNLARNNYWSKIDSRMGRKEDEYVLDIYGSSCFLDTPLHEILRQLEVDTLLLNGFTVSGTIRHTAMAAREYGYKVCIARDAVADRIPQAAVWNLFDLEMQYADVVDSSYVIEYLQGI